MYSDWSYRLLILVPRLRIRELGTRISTVNIKNMLCLTLAWIILENPSRLYRSSS